MSGLLARAGACSSSSSVAQCRSARRSSTDLARTLRKTSCSLLAHTSARGRGGSENQTCRDALPRFNAIFRSSAGPERSAVNLSDARDNSNTVRVTARRERIKEREAIEGRCACAGVDFG